MTMTQDLDVAIVGGGFTGAAVAYHLAQLRQSASVAVFEPRTFIGGGLAYDDADPAHRINVPAHRMSLIPDDESHFARWLEGTGAAQVDPSAVWRGGAVYPQRAVFGRYVRSQLAPLLSAGHVAHIPARVVSIDLNGGFWSIVTDTRAHFRARNVVLATTHPSPDPPAALKAIASDSRVISDALVPDALSTIDPRERILIVGSGLTMADVVASLDRQGHRGEIIALSRHGLRSRGHAAAAEPFGDFTRASGSASGFLHQIRQTIREAAEAGFSWQPVIDAVRRDAQTFWPTLSHQAQARIVRHLRAFWDVHRFRIAPQVEEVLDRRIAAGTLKLIAASVVGAAAERDALSIAFRPRGQLTTKSLQADRVIVTTGPAHGRITASQPYLAKLADIGRITADHLGLGLWCDEQSRAIDANGDADPTLYIAGPLARARFGELMGLPQVSAHALLVAQRLALVLGGASAPIAEPVAAN